MLLCIVTFLVPFEELQSIPEFKSGIFLVSAVALAIALLALMSGFRLRRANLVLVLLTVFVIWSFTSQLWTVDSEATLDRTITYLFLLIFSWMIWAFTDSKRKLMWLLYSYIMGCCVSLGMLFIAFVAGRNPFATSYERYTGGGMNVNELALLLDIGLLIAVYLVFDAPSKWKTIYWPFIPLAFVGVLLTGSRAGATGLVAAVVMALAITGSRNWKSIILCLLVIGCAAWLAFKIVPTTLLERVMEGREAYTFEVREEQWLIGLESWYQVPITGVGAGAFISEVVPRGGRELAAHNMYVSILVENGIVGMSLMLVVWALLTRMVLQLPRKERYLWIGVGSVLILVAITGSLEYKKIVWCLYAWIMVQSATCHKSLS